MNIPKTRATARQVRTVRGTRIGLAVAGAALIGYGLLGLPTQLGPEQTLGLLIWMAAGVLLHDGVLVPLATLSGAGLTRVGSRLRPASAAVLRGGLLTGTVVTGIAVLLLKAQSEARNTSVLEANYAANLLWFWAVLTAVATVIIVVLERRYRSGPTGTSLGA